MIEEKKSELGTFKANSSLQRYIRASRVRLKKSIRSHGKTEPLPERWSREREQEKAAMAAHRVGFNVSTRLVLLVAESKL
jgi:hypothetical protein